jgi:hypothetical protein
MTGCGSVGGSTSGSATTSTPVTAKISVLSNSSGVEDRVAGASGAVENNSIVTVYTATGQFKFSFASNSDGSFPYFPIGDDVLSSFLLTAKAAGKNESSAFNKTNPPQ